MEVQIFRKKHVNNFGEISAPMVKIKQAVAKLEEEIERMNVQIGVMEQSLLQAQLRDRVNYAVEVYGGI